MATAVLAGDLITDATRLTGIEGDGLTAPDSSVGVYGARTNLLPNGGFEQDARYWSGLFVTVGKVTNHAKFGASAGQVTITSSGQTIIARTNLAITGAPLARTTYAFHCWLWAEGNVVGKNMAAYFTELGGAAATAIMGGVTTAQVMIAGWNELTVVAAMAQADRNELRLNLQFTGLLSGDQFWIDGVSCYRDDFISPYIESSESQIEYAPATNLVTNPDFETNIAGWSGSGTTRTQSTDQAKNGTGSLKAVATTSGSGTVWVQGQYAASPVPQLTYGIGAWMYATPAIVGKTGQLIVNAQGGAQAQTTIGSDQHGLQAGWNYFFASGTVVQPDRTTLVPYLYLSNATIGDIYYVDQVKIGANYVTPAPTTVSRGAGRIQLPTAGLSARQGWVSLRLAPYWTNHQVAQDGRPDMPMTLWHWQDDATHALRLSFDGAYLTLTRTNGVTSDEAKVPWAPYRNVETTVAAQWDQYGASVSTEGQPFVGPFETFVSDDFERADTATGAGTTPVGNKTWYATLGTNPPRIKNGRLQGQNNPQVGNGYAWLDLGEIPARCGGTVSYIDGGGGGTSGHTFSWTAQLQVIDGLLHMFQDVDSWAHQVMEAGSFYYPSVGGRLYSSIIPTDGTPRDWAYATYGDTMAVEVGTDRYSFRHETVARMVSRYVFWEPNRGIANGTESRFERIFVDRYGSWSSLSTNIPTLDASSADVGSNGDGSGIFNGNVNWVMTGAGALSQADLTALHAVTTDPHPGTVSGAAKVKLVWPAETVALWGYQRPVVSIATRRAAITALTARRS